MSGIENVARRAVALVGSLVGKHTMTDLEVSISIPI